MNVSFTSIGNLLMLLQYIVTIQGRDCLFVVFLINIDCRLFRCLSVKRYASLCVSVLCMVVSCVGVACAAKGGA